MPWVIKKVKENFCVYKKTGDKKRVGCHKSKEAAKRQIRALYANEKGRK